MSDGTKRTDIIRLHPPRPRRRSTTIDVGVPEVIRVDAPDPARARPAPASIIFFAFDPGGRYTRVVENLSEAVLRLTRDS